MAKTKKNSGKMWLFAILFSISISISLADNVILNLNTKRPVSVTSEKFLSFTLDPSVILTGDLNSNILSTNVERSINMAKALSPAYVRIGGPQSNSFVFERELFPQNDTGFPGDKFSENIWNMVHQWSGKSDLDLITCIAPQRNENGEHTSWDFRHALDLISFSDHMGYNSSWQLGYECQTRCDLPGGELGRDVVRLRRILDAFPRYSTSIIAGPDVVQYKTKLQQQYLLDYFNSAGSALSAITWHPDLPGVSFTDNGVSVPQEDLLTDKENLQKIIGRPILKKPLWIAESKEEMCKNQFIGALVWARRLGNAATLGAQVLMRQPDNSNLFKPTPDFWVSLLHKTLVGPEVLDTKISSGNRTHTRFFCQCTKPSSKYEKGSLTIFGINLTPNKIVVNLKGFKIKQLHKYILLPGFDASKRMFAETVLLNNEPLTLENDKEIPDIKPIILNSEKGISLKLPSGGIGFWVIPNLKLKTCMSYEDEGIGKMLKRLTRRRQETEKEADLGHEELLALPEEVRSFLWQNKNRRQRKNRIGLEEEDEPRFRKMNLRKDLDKLEKLIQKGGKNLGEFNNMKENLKDYGVWKKEPLQKNYLNNLMNYYNIKPISSPPVNFYQEIPKTQTTHSITKKSRVRELRDENSSIESKLKNNEEDAGFESKRLRREAGDMNSLLNQEMFLQDEDDCQCRVVRGTKKSEDKKEIKVRPESVMIIGPQENINSEDALDEDGSGAHVTDEAIDIVENAPTVARSAETEKVKREDSKKVEKNLRAPTERTSILAVGQMPETSEELIKTSTVQTVNNRDTRESKPSFKNSENESNSKSKDGKRSTKSSTEKFSDDSSEPSLKQVRSIFAVAKRPFGVNAVSLDLKNPLIDLKLPVMGKGLQLPRNIRELQHKLKESAAKWKQSLEKARVSLKLPTLKPLSPLKRENSDLVKLKPAEILQKLKENAEKLRIKKAPDALKKVFESESTKLEEFRKKREEELEKLREELREKMLQDYKTELLNFGKKDKDDMDILIKRRETKGVKKMFDDLVQTANDDFKEKFTPVAEFFKPLQDARNRRLVSKKDSETPKLLQLPEILRLKKNVQEEYEDYPASEEVESPRPRRKIIPNMFSHLPFLVLGSRQFENLYDPIEAYAPTKEQSKNFLGDMYQFGENLDEDEISDEDPTWNYKNSRFSRIIRSVDSNPRVKVSGHLSFESDSKTDKSHEVKDSKNEKEHTRKRRDTETQLEETNLQDTNVMSTSEKPKELAEPISKKNVSLKDKFEEKKSRTEKFDTVGYNSEIYPQMYQYFPVAHMIRSLIPAMSGTPQILDVQKYSINGNNPRRIALLMNNNYPFELLENYPRCTRDQNTEFTPKTYSSDFASRDQEKSFIRRRRHIDNKIIKTSDKNMNKILTDVNQQKTDSEILDEYIQKENKVVGDLQNPQNYLIEPFLKKYQIKDSGKEIQAVKIPNISDVKGLQTGMEDMEGLGKSAMVIEITVKDLGNTQSNPESLMSSVKFQEKFNPLLPENGVQGRKSSDENGDLNYTFMQNMMNKLLNILSFFSSMT